MEKLLELSTLADEYRSSVNGHQTSVSDHRTSVIGHGTSISGHGMPFFVLAGGTNLLVKDGGIRGLVIRLAGEFSRASAQEDRIIAGAACPLSSLLRLSVQHGLSGLEFATGIPGLLGGAISMNAGSGEEGIGALVRDVHLVYPAGPGGAGLHPALEFSYRHCSLPAEAIITRATLQLRRVERKETILAQIRDRYKYRASHQPLREKSAGCIFKNPPGESAGKLIDQAGLKGISIGSAQVSTIHANFIINRNGASCSDVLCLMDMIQKRVYQSFGIALETEVLIVGEDGRAGNEQGLRLYRV
jgi:UDP-N-acetylmuramate dehydrogenase